MGSGAFGVSPASAASVPAGVGGGTGSFGQAGSQGRQRGQGQWHTLVVIHPRHSENQIKRKDSFFLTNIISHVASLLKIVRRCCCDFMRCLIIIQEILLFCCS